jgi:hypothetical protein
MATKHPDGRCAAPAIIACVSSERLQGGRALAGQAETTAPPPSVIEAAQVNAVYCQSRPFATTDQMTNPGTPKPNSANSQACP